MTRAGTLNSDAINTVLLPGAQPVMVTEYMPGGDGAQVINTASSGTVYIGTTSSVGPSSGVPVAAGASVQYTASGQLWAVLGTDATGPVTLVVSSLISAWSPSPEAVAAAILAAGVPNVITVSQVGTVNNPGGTGNAASKIFDVHSFATLIIELTATPATPVTTTVVGVQFYEDAAGTIPITQFDNVAVSNASTAAGGVITGAQVPVSGPFVGIFVADGGVGHSDTANVQGTNRPLATTHPIVAGYSSDGCQLGTGNVNWVSGVGQTLPTVFGTLFQGPVSAELRISNAALTGLYEVITASGSTLVFADTGEFHTSPAGVNLSKQSAFPANIVKMTFVPSATVAGVNVQAFLTPNV